MKVQVIVTVETKHKTLTPTKLANELRQHLNGSGDPRTKFFLAADKLTVRPAPQPAKV